MTYKVTTHTPYGWMEAVRLRDLREPDRTLTDAMVQYGLDYPSDIGLVGVDKPADNLDSYRDGMEAALNGDSRDSNLILSVMLMEPCDFHQARLEFWDAGWVAMMVALAVNKGK